MATIAESFDEHWVEQPGSLETPCWIWQRACKGKEVAIGGGYGCFKLRGKTVAAHRFAYEREYGPIPDGLQIRHVCHDTKCVNPAHMLTGTNDDNQLDKAVAGRTTAKLTAEDIKTIRSRVSDGELQREVAADYNLYQADVSNIVNKKYWRHV